MEDIELSVFTGFAFLGFVFALLSLPWDANASNVATIALMLWISLACLVMSINSIAWSAPVWCDIASKLIIGAYAGVPASLLCLFSRLYSVVQFQEKAKLQKRFYSMWVELFLALGFPVLVMCLHVVFQDSRYHVLERAGCFPSVYPSALSYIALFIWPLLFGLVSIHFAGFALRVIHRHKYQLSELLSASVNLSLDRFLRLFAFSSIVLICNVASGIFVLHANIHGVSLQPLNSMNRNLGHVDITPESTWKLDNQLLGLLELRWLLPTLALLFFGLFAFTKEMRIQHCRMVDGVKKFMVSTYQNCAVSRRSRVVSTYFVPDGVLPVYVPHPRPSSGPNDSIGSIVAIYEPSLAIPEMRGSVHSFSLPPILNQSSHRSRSEMSVHTRPPSASDSLPSIPSILTNESSSYLPSVSDSLPQSTSSVNVTESSSSSYTTCRTGSTSH